MGSKTSAPRWIEDDDINGYLSFRNIKKVRVLQASESNTYELIDNKKLISPSRL